MEGLSSTATLVTFTALMMIDCHPFQSTASIQSSVLQIRESTNQSPHRHIFFITSKTRNAWRSAFLFRSSVAAQNRRPQSDRNRPGVSRRWSVKRPGVKRLHKLNYKHSLAPSSCYGRGKRTFSNQTVGLWTGKVPCRIEGCGCQWTRHLVGS